MHSDWSDWRLWRSEREALFDERMAGIAAQIEELLHEVMVDGFDEKRARLMSSHLALTTDAPARSDARWST